MSEQEQHVETFVAFAKGSNWATNVKIIDTEWTIQVDEPTDDGGTNTGPNPMQYFAASLASCQNEQAQVVAEELELKIDGIDIKLEIDLDLSGFMGMADNSKSCYKAVRLEAIVSGNLNDNQIIELGAKVDARCPVLELLRASGCLISSTWRK